MMPLLVVAHVPVRREEDLDLARRLGFADGTAAGCRFRVSGPMDGGRRIVTFWESREAFELWRDEQLARVLLETGMAVPTFEVWEIDQAFGL